MSEYPTWYGKYVQPHPWFWGVVVGVVMFVAALLITGSVLSAIGVGVVAGVLTVRDVPREPGRFRRPWPWRD